MAQAIMLKCNPKYIKITNITAGSYVAMYDEDIAVLTESHENYILYNGTTIFNLSAIENEGNTLVYTNQSRGSSIIAIGSIKVEVSNKRCIRNVTSFQKTDKVEQGSQMLLTSGGAYAALQDK